MLLGIILLLRCAAEVMWVDLPAGFDARAYVVAARAFWAGLNPYDFATFRIMPPPIEAPRYLYPPLIALTLMPLVSLPIDVASYVCMVLAALNAVMAMGLLQRLIRWPLAIAAVALFPPTWHTIYHGQVNLLLSACATAGCLALLSRREVTAGVLLAIGALVKVTPVLLFYSLLITWRVRAVIAGILTALLIGAISTPFAPPAFWLDGMLQALRQQWATAELISLPAILIYRLGPLGEMVAGLLVPALLLITAARVPRLPVALGLAALLLLPLLIARVTWSHHAVMALPALALMWQHTPRMRTFVVAMWLLMALGGSLWITLAVISCWIACCWPTTVHAAIMKEHSDDTAQPKPVV